MTLRAAVYARVSSAAQREADTIASQLRVLPEYVKAQGWEYVGAYVDDGKSARTGKLDKRDGFARLVRDAEAGKFDVVVVVDIDRLTRTGDISERASILAPFQRLGIDIVTPSSGRQDLRTMLGEMYVTFKALFAAEENRVRSERARRGQLEAARRGFIATGKAPYGLKRDPATRELVHETVKANIVREIIERVAAGESCYQVAQDLDARGVPTPGHSSNWQRNRVWDIVNATYPVGEWLANKEHNVKVAVPPIVDRATWDRAQVEMRRHRKRGLAKRTRHVYLLDGIGVCGRCGSRMLIRSASNNRVVTYVCGTRLKKPCGTFPCPAPTVRVADIDALVWERIRGALRDPGLPALLASERSDRADNARDWTADIEGYRSHLARLTRVEAAVLARFRRGTITEAALDAELAGLEKERRAVEAQVETAEDAIAAAQVSGDQLDLASNVVEALSAAFDVPDMVERRELVRALIREPVVFHGRAAHFELAILRTGAAGGSTGDRGTVMKRAPDDSPGAVRIRLVAKAG